jgi:hypothetical protein
MLLVIAVFMVFGASALFIAGGFSGIAGASSASDILIYLGAIAFTYALIATAISAVFWIGGYAIIWSTHAMCKADKFRAGQILEQRIAQQHVRQHIPIRR